jgi:predicted lipoprotein with Yx(FWY)xxD motif
MRKTFLLAGLLLATSSLQAAAPQASGGPARVDAPLLTPPGITLQQGRTGQTLSDAAGQPLLTYDKDEAGKSNCNEGCPRTPVAAPDGAPSSPLWSVVARADGSKQWALRGKPVYTAPKDAKPIEGDDAKAWKPVSLQPAEGLALPPGIGVAEIVSANGAALVDERGMPLYTFSGEAKSAPGAEWVPVRAGQLSHAVGEFNVITKAGQSQWAYQGLPLYSFTGDTIVGDAKGQHAGPAFRVALVMRYFLPAEAKIQTNHFGGDMVVAADGRTLYIRDRAGFASTSRNQRIGVRGNPAVGKVLGTMTCDADCTKHWQPLAAPAGAVAQGFWDVVARPDGARQWAYRGFPLYTYDGDKKPGDMNGHEIYDYVVGTDPYKVADAAGIPIRGATALLWRIAVP